MPPLRPEQIRDSYDTRPSRQAASWGPQQPPWPPGFYGPRVGSVLFLIGWFTSGRQLYWVLEFLHEDGQITRYYALMTCSY